jgi:peptidylprolyl isomerase
LLASLDAPTRLKLESDPKAMADLLRNLLLQRAVLDQARTDHWEQRPEVAALLSRTHDEVLAQNYLTAHAALPAGYPSEAELQTAYDQNKAKLLQPRQYHLSELYYLKSPGTPAETQKRLLAIRAQIAHARGGFETAAKSYQSQGLAYRDLGFIAETQLIPAVRTAVSGMLEGAISDPICTEAGCTLIHMIATRPAGPASLADIRDSLIRALRQQKQQDLERAYANALLQKQPVAINEIELSHLSP